MTEHAREPISEAQHEANLAEANENGRQSEDRFRLLVESVSDYAIFMLDPNGTVLSWNKGAERFKGYSADEIIGRSYTTFYTQEDRENKLPAELLAKALRDGRVESEGWRIRKDGTRFWADVVITAIRDKKGELLGYSKVTRDLTERKLAEDQRRQFELLITSVTDYAILMLTPEGIIASWNQGAENLKGYTPQEIIGQPYEKFFTPEAVAAGKPRELLRKAYELGHIEDEGWRMRKDGTRFWASAVITTIRDEKGKFVGYSKVTRDLTERKLAEDQRRQFQLLIKSVTDYAIIMLDPNGCITSWTKGAEALKGYREEEVLGLPNRIFYTPDDAKAGKAEHLLAMAAEQGHIEDEGWRVRKDGTRFWADVVITAVSDETGKLIGFAKITRDLTERKAMEELAARTAQLQASNRLKSEFLATMSHELRTPLNSIIGFTELVLMTNSQNIDELGSSNLNTVLRNARHLLSLISEILDLSKIEAGQSTVHAGPFDPTQLALTAVNSTRSLADQKGLSLEFEAEPGLDLVVSDETKVRQILINMVSNAVKFTDVGGVKVALSANGPDGWAVTVRDTGIGIAPEHHDMVFQEFRQVDSSTTRSKGGTGLGLAISRKLANLLEGDLTLESALGAGSTFTLVLPRQLQGDFAPTRTLPSPVAPLAGAGGQGVTAQEPGPEDERPLVLAIDDDPEALHLIAEKLKNSRYQVVTATSAESALNLLRDIRPAAITLDVLMPKIDGWMTLRRLKSNAATADIPVILLSFLENKGLAMRLGASDYLAKPIDARALIESLDQVTGQAVERVS
jgi:PAS domain S-box-containing protein